MTIDLNGFLHSVVRFVAERVEARHGPAAAMDWQGTPRRLWRWACVESDATDPYTVIRAYGGPGVIKHPLPRYSLQVLTVGTDIEATANQAQRVFEALLAEDGQPLQSQEMTAYSADGEGTAAEERPYQLVAVEPLQRPGLIARDERGRSEFVFNVDVGFFRK